MTNLLIGLYGVYLVFVGYNGNTNELMQSLSDDKDFVSWIVIVGVLALLSKNETSRKFVAPFVGLMAIVIALRPETSNQVAAIYHQLTGSKT